MGSAVKITSTFFTRFLLNLTIFGNLKFDKLLSKLEIFLPTEVFPHRYFIFTCSCLTNNLISWIPIYPVEPAKLWLKEKLQDFHWAAPKAKAISHLN